MSAAQQIRSRLDHLDFNREYDASVFEGIASKETIKKTLQRSRDKIGKTTAKYFYIKYTPQSKRKAPYEVYDDQEEVVLDPTQFSFNAFWQSGKPTTQKVSSVIRNYLMGMDQNDICLLCRKFGKNRVKAELIATYKAFYKQGFIDVKGHKVPLEGRYDRNPVFKEILKMIHDC
ncbi:MAG: hypothetical protein L3J42_02905 [Hydrogenimonas sp.]|nr:hypothetical protein [Hydrogenimonas sp.]